MGKNTIDLISLYRGMYVGSLINLPWNKSSKDCYNISRVTVGKNTIDLISLYRGMYVGSLINLPCPLLFRSFLCC